MMDRRVATPGVGQRERVVAARDARRTEVDAERLSDLARPEVDVREEVGARGAAMIAAVGTGLYPDYPTASAHMTRIAATYLPRPWRVDQLAERYQRYRVLRELTASLLSSPPSKPVPGAT